VLPGNDERHIRFYINAIADGAGGEGAEETAIVYAVETTEQKALEIKMAQGQKMQAVGQLAGGIAHDFNNVLTAIIMASDLLLTNHRPSDPSFPDIMNIKQNANRAASLVRQLLAFSRKQTLRPEVLNLTDVLADLRMLLSRLVGNDIKLKVDHGRDLWPVRADIGQFEQVIVNLAVNARDAMPDGGDLTIRTRNVTTDECKQFGYRELVAADYALVEIEDTGTGIAPELIEKIFEPFFTTKEVGKGTGLGLSQVQGFIDQSGGHVRIQSEKNLGTTVRLYLPQAAEESKTDATRPDARETPGAAAQEVVLAVEDNESLRRVLVKQLRELGYEVLQAETGEAALKILRTAPRVDLLLTDVVMPGGLNGYELARKAGLLCPDLKVLFTSGFPETALGPEAPLKPDEVLLGKPYRKDELAQKVRQALATQPTGT
jgi:two-component system cell cycle sensor histidine kinase/response regulator CckA